jgi:hypothetical protein
MQPQPTNQPTNQTNKQPTNQATIQLTNGRELRDAQVDVPWSDQPFLRFDASLGSAAHT